MTSPDIEADAAPSNAAPTAPLPIVFLVLGSIVLAATGLWVHLITTTTYLFDVSNSSVAVSAASTAQILATAAVLIPFGRAIDRRGPRFVLRFGSATAIAGSLLAALAVTLDNSLTAPLLVVSVAVLSTVTGAYQPVMQACLSGMVPVAFLATLITIQFTAINSAQIVGPLLATTGGGLISTATRFALNMAFFVPLLVGGRLIHRWYTAGDAGDRLSLPLCLRAIRTSSVLRASYLFAASIGFLMEPAISLGPALGDLIAGNSDSGGVVLTAFAVGSVVGGVRSKYVRSGLAAAGQSIVIAAVGFAVATSAPSMAVLALGFGIVGAGFLWTGSALVSGAFLHLDPANRGQLMAMWAIAIFGGRLVATVLVSPVADLLGPRYATGLLTGLALAIALGAYVRSRSVDVHIAGSGSTPTLSKEH